MISYGLVVLIGAIVLVIYIVYALIKKPGMKRVIVTCVFIIYLTGVAAVTLFPIVYDSPVEYTDTVKWYNWIPFKTISEALNNGVRITAITQIVGNIVLAIPFGIIVSLLFEKLQWWKKLLAALSFTIAIELSQMLIGFAIGNMYRNIDIDDVILNILGACSGYGIYAIVFRKKKR